MARKVSNWAKAAGEFYRKNKGKNGITSFTDVLKSSAFKTSYYAKHGKSNSLKHGGGVIDEDVVVPSKTESPVSGGDETVAPETGSAPIADSESAPSITGGKRRTRGKKSSRRQSRKGRKTAKKGCMKLW